MARKSIAELARTATDEIAELLGKPIEGVRGVSPLEGDEGGWVVTIAVLELARVPDTTDVLADYEVILDEDGAVTGYQQTHRYHRARIDD